MSLIVIRLRSIPRTPYSWYRPSGATAKSSGRLGSSRLAAGGSGFAYPVELPSDQTPQGAANLVTASWVAVDRAPTSPSHTEIDRFVYASQDSWRFHPISLPLQLAMDGRPPRIRFGGNRHRASRGRPTAPGWTCGRRPLVSPSYTAGGKPPRSRSMPRSPR